MISRPLTKKIFLMLLTVTFTSAMIACGSGGGRGGKGNADATPPSVVITSSAANPTNLLSIPVIVTFNETVTGFEESDITIENGAISDFTETAPDDGTVYTFNITSPINTITLDIKADVCTDVTGNKNKAAAQFSITYHDHKPVATITSTVGSPTRTDTIPVTITFDEAVTGFTQDDITIANGEIKKNSFNATIPNTTYTFDIINPVAPLNTITVDIEADKALDSAGNGNETAAQFVLVYDIQKPVPAISSPIVSPTNVSTIPVNITFSEAVNDFSWEDITIENGAIVNFSGSGAHYSFNINTPTDTVTVDINANVCRDSAGNFNTASTQFSIVYDAIRPGVTISSSVTSPTNLTEIPVIVTFDKAVTGFTSADIVISNGEVSSFTGAGENYSFNIIDITSPSGDITVNIPGDAAIDMSGNGNTSAQQFSIDYDYVRPTITSITSSTENGFYRSGSAINITVHFSEPVTLTGGSLAVTLNTGDAIIMGELSNATLASATYTVGAEDNSADLTASSIALTAGSLRDAANNVMEVSLPTNNIATVKDIVIDTQAPIISSISSDAPDGVYTTGAAINIIVNFSEIVTLESGNLSVALNATPGAVIMGSFSHATSANALYTVIAGDRSNKLNASNITAGPGAVVSDRAGNSAAIGIHESTPNIAHTKTIVIDTEQPSITSISSTSESDYYKSGDTINITVDFSEPVKLTGGTLNAILDTGVSVSLTENTPSSYTGTYIIADGQNSADLDATSFSLSEGGSLTDQALNNADLTLPSAGMNQRLAEQKDIVVDTTVPTILNITSTSPDGTYSVDSTINVTVTFSEAVTLSDGDLNVTINANESRPVVSISPFIAQTSTGVTYTVRNGDDVIDLDATDILLSNGTLTDLAGNPVTVVLPANNTIAHLKNINIDAKLPYITSITSSTADGYYKAGENVNVTVNFSEPVWLVGDNLNVTLDTGKIASITPDSCAGATSCSGVYEIENEDNSTDLDSTGIALQGIATLRDIANNEVSVSLPAATIKTGSAIVVDTLIPAITSIISNTANGSYKAGTAIDVTVNFSENVTLANGSLNVSLDTGDIISILPFTNAASAKGIYIISAGDNSNDLNSTAIALSAGSLRDLAGNNSDLSLPAVTIATGSAIVIDTTAPVISSITSTSPNATYSIGGNVNITVNFSEPVTLAGGSLAVTLSTTDVISISTISSASSARATYTVSAGDSSADLESTAIALSAGTLMDAAGNNAAVLLPSVGQRLAALKNIVIDGIELTITQARTMDSNGNGKIGNYKLTFNKNINDSTFPGYVANSIGNSQSDWLVAGYVNVRMAHGTAAPETDNANDNIIYVAFDENTAVDSNAKPDLTTTNTPRLKDLNGNSLAQVITASIAESDGAKPIITSASGVTGSASLSINFSEPVDTDGSIGSGCNSAIQTADLTYSNLNGSGAASISSMGSDTNGCDDSKISITLNTALTPGDINVDKLAAAAGAVFDPADNAINTTLVFVTGSIAPYVLGVTATEARKIRITYSEPVNISQATTLENYTLIEDPVQTPCGGSGSDSVSLTGSVSLISDAVYELSTNADQCSTTTYRLTVSANVTDQNENAALINPRFGTFLGNERLKLTSASCLTTKTLLVVFNKPVKSGTGAGGAETINRYKITGSSNLGSLSTVVRGTSPNTNKVTLTHAINQTGGAYTVIGSNATNGDGFDDSTYGAIEYASAAETLQSNPNDRAPWSGCGTAIDQFDQGPIASDPFGDASDFGFLAAYNNQLYIGPNAKGNSANRMNPDGSNPINLLFEFEKDTDKSSFFSSDDVSSNTATTRDGSIAVPPYVTLGWTGCTSNNAGRNTGCGPDNENGRGLFNIGTLGGTQYLFLGGARSSADFDYIYYTSDTDTTLNYKYIDMDTVSGTATQGLSSLAIFNNSVYAGMAKTQTSGAQNSPDFGKINFSSGSSGGDCTPGDNCNANDGKNGLRFFINHMPQFGGGGQYDRNNSPNWAWIVGVDVLYVFNNRLYAANGGHNSAGHNGAIIRSNNTTPAACSSVNTCADWTNITPSGNTVWYNSNSRFSLELVKTYDLIASDKAHAQFADFNGNLYITRTACHVSASGSTFDSAAHTIGGCTDGTDTNREAQLWKCTPGTTGGVSDCDTGDWTLIDGNADGLTNFGHTGNRSLTMLVKNGSHLYVGFDNRNGIEIWRTKASVTNPNSESDFEQIGSAGLGNPASMKQIYSGISIQQGVDYYIYISAGLGGNPVAVYRNKNN